MSKIAPNMVQNPINNMYSFYKPCNNEERVNDDNDHRTKGMSFLALVFFVFFYVCIFNFFNISVCNVVNDGRFLFFLSNTLVMILLADYGAFTSSSSKVVNVYESYGKVPVHRNELVELPVATYVEVDDTEECVADAPPVPAIREEVKLLTYHVSCEDIGTDDDEEGMEETKEGDEQVVEKTEEEDNDEFSRMSDEEEGMEETIEEDEQVMEITEEEEKEEEDDDEFSRMSDEELNKRVEEFIWRLKTQIRLQAARDTD